MGSRGLSPSASFSVPWPANRPQGRARRPRETSSTSGRAALTPVHWPWCALQKQMQGMMWNQRSSYIAIDLLLQRTSFLLAGVKTLRRTGDQAGRSVGSNVLRPGGRNEMMIAANEAASGAASRRGCGRHRLRAARGATPCPGFFALRHHPES